jgi:hypothetical protein
MFRWFRKVSTAVVAAAGLLLVAYPERGVAKEPQPVEVTVFVLDEAGAPISTATVRHPLEASRNPVNSATGSWKASVLYLPDGTEFKFLPETELKLEVSAPGYQSREVMYLIKKRKNVAQVVLSKMDLNAGDDEEEEDLVIQFGRDKPIDGATSTPAP